MPSQYLQEFILCLSEERFYDAHEALEVLWFPRRSKRDDETMLLKGYINAAVSFELIKRGRKTVAPNPFKTYLKYKKLRSNLNLQEQNRYLKIESYIDDLVLKNKWEFLLA